MKTERQTARQTERKTEVQTFRQLDRQTNRQTVKHTGRQTGTISLSGQILDGILMLFGQQCRLENISQTGTWIEDEHFDAAGQTVRRTAGDKAPDQQMRQWSFMKDSQPHIFWQASRSGNSQLLL